MTRGMLNWALQLLPAAARRRLGYKLLRSACGPERASTELFVPPYDGWIEWNSGLGGHVFALYGLVRAGVPEVVVEIGSARGRSTCALALACLQNGRGRVYAIDPHRVNDWTDMGNADETLPFLTDRLRTYGLSDWCEVIRSESGPAAAAWRRPIDLLFIDGDHTYEGVRADFHAFEPWLHDRSLVVFHDSAWEYAPDPKVYRQFYPKDVGVAQFLTELQEDGYESVTLATGPGLTILCPRKGGFDFLNRHRDRAATPAVGATR